LTNDRKLLRAVIDTNLLVAALVNPGGTTGRVLAHWRAGDFEHVASEATLHEAQQVVGARWVTRIANPIARDRLLKELRQRSVLVTAPVLENLTLKDAGDRRLTEAAKSGRASYLITADKEILLARGYGSVEFVTAHEFLKVLGTHTS
tara:strand:- start:2820 stop:3263 length:444 start_codon:yes stop_codon:yes gene_type:complete